MSRHSLQQWDHYKRQMDQLMARPDFLTNLAQSAGAMSTLVNNMLDPSVSDWSTATASGKPLLTSQEQVQFKEMLDPYVPHIRAFFKGERSTEQHGGAEELVKKVQQQLTKNMTYMGQHNVVMYGGTQVDVLRQKEQQANREKKDVTVYPGSPPVDVPFRLITTSIIMFFDVIRMLISLTGWERGAEILSVIVSAMEVARGEWKRGITSFMGYFGSKSLWIGQAFKVFIYMFQTIPTAMHHMLLDDVTEMGRKIIFGMALNIFQTVAPAPIRQIFIKNIDIINKNNELLTEFFSDPSRKKQYKFDPTDPRYAIYFNQYSWGDLTEFQSYMIEARCTTQMATFHEEIKDALDEEERKEKASIPQIPNTTALPITGTGIARSLLGIMGMLPDPNCKTPKKTIIQHVIDLITGESNDSKASSLLTDLTAFAGTLPSLPKMPDTSPLSDMASSVFQTVTKKAQNAAEAVRGKVGPLMPKQSKWREQLEQLQKEVANRQEHLTLLPQIHDLEGKIQKLDGEIQQAESNPGQKGRRSVFSTGKGHVLGTSSQPAAPPFVFQASKRGGRITRRIRASTRALRQRARE